MFFKIVLTYIFAVSVEIKKLDIFNSCLVRVGKERKIFRMTTLKPVSITYLRFSYISREYLRGALGVRGHNKSLVGECLFVGNFAPGKENLHQFIKG